MKCDRVVEVGLEDVEKWLSHDRLDIVSVLTWYCVKGRNPPCVLIIPKKKHLKNHVYLKRFHKPCFENDEHCVFHEKGRCKLGKLKPLSCELLEMKKKGLNKEELKSYEELVKSFLKQKVKAWKERELLSKVINTAKEQTSALKLAKALSLECSDTHESFGKQGSGRFSPTLRNSHPLNGRTPLFPSER